MKIQKLHNIISIVLNHRTITAAIVLMLLCGSGAAVALKRRNTDGAGNVKGVSTVSPPAFNNNNNTESQTAQKDSGTPVPTSEPTAPTTGSPSQTVVARTTPSTAVKPSGTVLPAATVTPLPVNTPTPTPTPMPRSILGGSSAVEILPANTNATAYGEFSTSDGSEIYWQPLYKNTFWPGNEPNFTNMDPASMPDSFVYMDTAPNVATHTLGYYIVYTGGQIVTGTPWHEFSVMAVDPASGQSINAVSVRYNFQ